jgi:23S rRNA pseudouridine2604 synthase
MNIKLDVPVGQWRYLSEKELEDVSKLIASSSKTYDGSK